MIALLAPLLGLDDLTLTTNGVLLAQRAGSLKAAGLGRLTVSLDSLDEQVFKAMNDVGVSVGQVLEGIDAAVAAGLGPLKINVVVQRGLNDHTLVDLAGHFHGSGHIVRFIEYMDVGTTNGWCVDHVVPARQIVDMIHAHMPLEPAEPNYTGEVAKRWRYRDGGGEIGVISSVSQPFCGDCTRLRLSPDGRLYTCLFASRGADVKAVLRTGADDKQIAAWIGDVWRGREDRYSEVRTSQTFIQPRIEMSYIGG